MRSVYLVGEPGAGKSTLMRALTQHLERAPRTKPFAHDLLLRDGRVIAAELGASHATFPGTDRLSMGVQPKAIEWVESAPVPILLAEGDRLATRGFLGALAASSSTCTVVWLNLPPDAAAERRAARGSNQSEAWVRGRRTKVTRLLSEPDWAVPDRVRLVMLDATMPVAELVEHCRCTIDAIRDVS